MTRRLFASIPAAAAVAAAESVTGTPAPAQIPTYIELNVRGASPELVEDIVAALTSRLRDVIPSASSTGGATRVVTSEGAPDVHEAQRWFTASGPVSVVWTMRPRR